MVVRLLAAQCRAHDVTFAFTETGTAFVKDGKTYRLRDLIAAQGLEAFTEPEMRELADIVRPKVPSVQLRGV